MQPYSKIHFLIFKLRTSDDGAIMPIVGLAIAAIIASVGISVDIGRSQVVESKLYFALDAAALAAGAKLASLHEQDLVAAEVKNFVQANFPDGYVGATLSPENIHVTYDVSRRTLNVSATTQVPTTFMKILGYEAVQVSAASEVTRAPRGLELVLVLDNTASMAGSGMIDLQDASTKLLDTLYGEADSLEDVFVGIVPYSHTVNIGLDRESWRNEMTRYWHWDGCVMARAGGGAT